MAKLRMDVKALGLALGITWGVGVLILGLLDKFFGYGADMVYFLSGYYIGFEATFLGSLIGGVWGFVDAGVGGVIIAWLYNKFSK